MAATKHAQLIKQDSQNYLTTALLQLLETKDLTDITIAQVVRRAGVSRMAFYRNFETLTDVLTAYFEPQISARFADIMNNTPQTHKLDALSTFFTELAPTLALASKRGFESVIQLVFQNNMTEFYQTGMHWDHIDPVKQKYWVAFMTAGVYNIWHDWLLNGQQEDLSTIHDILAMFQQSTLTALNKDHV